MRYTLDNGLTVVLEPQKAAPVVAIQVWVKAGSADETREEAGLAHLHEHMLFKGTKRRGLGEIARDIEGRGGEVNAWTSFDQTVYHVVLASAFASAGVDVLADAVRNSAFDRDELAREIEVVVEEIKRATDSPSRRVSRDLFETAYEKHPYRYPVLGTAESVRSFTREKVVAFFEKHYAPDNMVVVAVGDFEEKQLRRDIEQHFGGDWHRKAPRLSTRVPEPKQRGLRVALQQDQVKESHLSLAWHIPEVESDELPALDMLAVLLGQGESSRLSLALKIQQSLVNETWAYAYTPKDPGLMVAGATLHHDQLEAAMPALLAEVYRLAAAPVSEDELAVGKAMVEADAVHARETVQGVARKLGFYQSTTGSLEFEAEYYRRIAALKPSDVLEAANRYLVPDAVTFSGLFPSGASVTEDRVRELLARGAKAKGTAKPAAPRPLEERTPPRGFKRPVKENRGILEATLANGARVIVKPERAVPLVAIRAAYPGGLRFETEQNNGITQLYSRLMTKATKRHDAAALAQEMDALAASLNGSAGRNSVGLRGEFLAKHFDRGMRLFAECLTETAFDTEELERERAVLLQDLHSREDSPSSLVFDLFGRTLYTRHPYRFDTLGEEASVKALAPKDLAELQRVSMHPANLTLCIVGDVEPDAAFALAEELFGKDLGARPQPPEVPVEPPQASPRRAFHLLDKAQAHLVYGFLGTTLTSPERHVLDVLTSVLSGQGGRLFVELRDKKSLAYSVSSFSVEGLDPGYVGVYMGTSPEKTQVALEGIHAELAKVREHKFTDAEIERAQRYLIGSHAIGLQKNSARAAVIAFDEAYGIGAANYQDYEKQIRAVTAEQILALAQRLLDPKRATLAVLGPKQADVPLPGV